MSRLHKYLIIVFCLGVFLCGVGAGVAFTEFSAIAYGGEQILGTTDMRTENFYVKYEPGEEQRDISIIYPTSPGNIQIDNNVPKNTVRFCVTYNAECVEPFAYWDEQAERIVLAYHWNDNNNDMALMLEAKDIILQNLKEGKLVYLERPGLEKVTVLVNQNSVDDVSIW